MSPRLAVPWELGEGEIPAECTRQDLTKAAAPELDLEGGLLKGHRIDP